MPDRIAIRTNRDLAPYIDHTLLKPEVSPEDLVKLCNEARTYAKGVVRGSSEQSLSPEEQQAIDAALRGPARG